jgi:mono/diheme cytochrome c family protein
VTFQTLATAGQTLYSGTCATCHGKNGEGSQACPVTIWGTDATLGTYNGLTLFTDAQGMLDYVSKRMPLTAPGTLTHQQAVSAVAYILVQAHIVSSSTVFDESKLGGISIP